jgi:hypothetical protein
MHCIYINGMERKSGERIIQIEMYEALVKLRMWHTSAEKIV